MRLSVTSKSLHSIARRKQLPNLLSWSMFESVLRSLASAQTVPQIGALLSGL